LDLGLRDRVVLITGAGGGAGPTLARAFAAEGASVALHHRPRSDGKGAAGRARTAADEITATGGRALAVPADLRKTDAIATMVEHVAAELGPVAVLVTATSAYHTERLAEISDES
jgi:3-oxoacyl-[acyl-carrier protein] reductase